MCGGVCVCVCEGCVCVVGECACVRVYNTTHTSDVKTRHKAHAQYVIELTKLHCN